MEIQPILQKHLNAIKEKPFICNEMVVNILEHVLNTGTMQDVDSVLNVCKSWKGLIEEIPNLKKYVST